MKISGFTFVKNGSILGYPYIESIKSLLLVCDEVIVAVGHSEDDTLEKIFAINNPRLKIIETSWNDLMCDRGYTYAQQKMIAQFNCTGDWAFYLECDEIIHDADVPHIKFQLEKYHKNLKIEALVFDYYHFYGDMNHIAVSPRWYKKAPRIIRNTIRTWAPDGLFWLVMQKNRIGRYPNSVAINCYIYHYGHIRKIQYMHQKNQRVERYWGKSPKEFNSYGNIDYKSIQVYIENHPSIIQHWLENHAEKNFIVNPNYKLTIRDKRHRILMLLSKVFKGLDFSKKHFKLIKE